MVAKTDFYREIEKNRWKSIFLFVIIFILVVLLAYFIGLVYDPRLSSFFIFFGAIAAILQILIGYYSGDKIVLSSVGAIIAEGPKYIYLNNVVEGLCLAAGITKPKVYVMDNPDINAFATGRDPEHSSICITTGAIAKLKRQEIEGVIAHELSHIKNYDIRFTMLTAVLVGFIAIVSDMFLRSMFYGGHRDSDNKNANILGFVIGIALAILAPLSAKLVQLAISRKREFLADATGVQLTRYPSGLANALQKIKEDNQMKVKINSAVAPLFFAPVKKFSALFSTHPDIDVRIQKLRDM